jgi:hypothetical protein
LKNPTPLRGTGLFDSANRDVSAMVRVIQRTQLTIEAFE